MTKIMLSIVLLITALCLTSLLPAQLFADYYQYSDSRGVVNITNTLESVPRKYRSNMKVVREEPLGGPALAKPAPEQVVQTPAIGPTQAAVAAPEPETKQAVVVAPEPEPAGKFTELYDGLASRYVWLKPLTYLAVVLAFFVAIVKLTSMLSSRLLAKAIYLSFFMGVFVFMYKSYVEHVVESTAKIKNNAITIMKKASSREVPAPEGELPPANVPTLDGDLPPANR